MNDKEKKEKRYLTTAIFGALFFSVTILLGVAVFADTGGDMLEIDFFDVGQGDAILIQTPSRHTILIDGGRDNTVSKKIAEELALYERTIDLIILTHPDLDHVGGLPDVLRRYRVGAIILPRVQKDLPAYQKLLERAEKEHIPIQNAVAGDVLRLGMGFEMAFFAPTPGLLESEDLNNSSIVVKLTYNKRSVLFTGDAEEESERVMMARNAELSADILKIGHHGSRSSSSSAFLEAVDAFAGIVSAGKDNTYGHPHPDVLERMAHQGISAYRTDRQGDIEVISDGEFITITTEK